MTNAAKQVAITPAELGVMVSRSTVTLERWRRLRRGPPHFYVGNRALYLLSEVEAWLAAQRERTGRDNDGTDGGSKRRRRLSAGG